MCILKSKHSYMSRSFGRPQYRAHAHSCKHPHIHTRAHTFVPKDAYNVSIYAAYIRRIHARLHEVASVTFRRQTIASPRSHQPGIVVLSFSAADFYLARQIRTKSPSAIEISRRVSPHCPFSGRFRERGRSFSPVLPPLEVSQ